MRHILYPKRSRAALWREIDQQVLCFHEENGRALALNASAAWFWRACDGCHSLAELLDLASAACGPAGMLVQERLTNIAQDLLSSGFIDNLEKLSACQSDLSLNSPPPTIFADLPEMQEIPFEACDCSGGAYGVIRNSQCDITGTPQQITSGIGG